MNSEDEKKERIGKLEELRAAEIAMHGLRNVDGEYSFYYDETNNIRKLHIRDGRLNVVELKDFVLGGVVRKGKPVEFDLVKLRSDLKLQKNIGELKLKHIAQGDFLNLVKSEKLATFLQWLLDSKAIIHYHHLDPFYWSIVDIIDSIVLGIGEPAVTAHRQILKFDLYEVLKNNLSITVTVFDKYEYPNLSAETRMPFIKDLIELLENSPDVLEHFNHYMLKGVLQYGLRLDSLSFIEDNIPRILIDDFSNFYKSRVRLFNKSIHVFDDEPNIVAHFDSDVLFQEMFGGNYRFSCSQHEEGIQVSDIVVGVLGKMHTYFRQFTAAEIEHERSQFDEICWENLKLINQLLGISDQVSNAFLHHVASGHDLAKTRIFFG